MSYYRMEVWYKGRWIGYYEGLHRLEDEDKIEWSPDCSMHPIPSKVFPDPKHKRKQLKSWATKMGWQMLHRDIRDAKIICYDYRIPWRILRADNPGEIVYDTNEQIVVKPLPHRYRVLAYGECEKGQNRIPPWLARRAKKRAKRG